MSIGVAQSHVHDRLLDQPLQVESWRTAYRSSRVANRANACKPPNDTRQRLVVVVRVAGHFVKPGSSGSRSAG